MSAAAPPFVQTLGLFALAVVVHAPSLWGGWFWDDSANVTENTALRSPRGLVAIWTDPTASYQYYPLAYTGFWLEYHLFGHWPRGFHGVNLVLHATNAVLAHRVMRQLAVPLPWFTAALWAIHPVQVETVGWITEFKSLLATLFALLATSSWLRFAARDKRRWYIAGTLCFAAALLAKTAVLPLPIVLALIEWWQRPAGWRRRSLWLAPWLLLGLAAGRMTVWRETLTATTDLPAALQAPRLSVLEKAMVASRALWFYAGTLAAPFGQVPIHPRFELGPPTLAGWFAIVSAVAVPLVLWKGRGRWGRGPFVAVSGFGLMVAPALGVARFQFHCHSFVADHFQYLPGLGLIALAVAVVDALTVRRPTWRRPIALGVLLAFGLLCFRQSYRFADAESVWRATVNANPRSWAAFNNLGQVVMGKGRLAQAELCFRTALAIEHDLATVHDNLGNVLGRLGRPDRLAEALTHLEIAAGLEPRQPRTWHRLGNALAQLGRFAAAETAYQKSLALEPDAPATHLALAVVYLELNRHAEARAHVDAALALDPNYPTARALRARLAQLQP